MGNKLLSKMCPTHPTHPTQPTQRVLHPTHSTHPDTLNLLNNKEKAGVSGVSGTSAKSPAINFCVGCVGGVAILAGREAWTGPIRTPFLPRNPGIFLFCSTLKGRLMTEQKIFFRGRKRPPRYVSKRTAMVLLDLSLSGFRNWVRQGILPPPAAGTPLHEPRWSWAEIESWLAGDRSSQRRDLFQTDGPIGTKRGPPPGHGGRRRKQLTTPGAQ
jgi:hypothetical protein